MGDSHHFQAVAEIAADPSPITILRVHHHKVSGNLPPYLCCGGFTFSLLPGLLVRALW